MAEFLLKNGAEPNLQNVYHVTPFLSCFFTEIPDEYCYENIRVTFKLAKLMLQYGGKENIFNFSRSQLDNE